ncbi:MAG: cyclic nucleotide-binding domain-containing protein [Spirochaetales bacterium]|nr:cyclic nucleotide-binding domain-containing protein [Spirochaetales bacterium]
MKENLTGLELGEIVTFESKEKIFTRGEKKLLKPVYYIMAGLVKIEYNLPSGIHFKYYLQPNNLFGMEEAICKIPRIADASAMEVTKLYRWETPHFYQATENSHRLAITCIRNLSRLIRILNSEYGEKLEEIKRRTGNMENNKEDDIPELNLKDAAGSNLSKYPRFRKIFADKQILIKEGEILDQLFWILRGEVYIAKKMGRKYKVLAKVGKGELLGEMSFFDKSLTSATVIADGEVEALVFSRQNFKEIFFTNPKWIKQLFYSLSKRVIVMVQKLSIDVKS